MNWKLIFCLSLFGLAMAFATVYWIPSKAEPVLWVAIAIVCGYLIAKNTTGRYFLHGFLVSIVNCIWITGAHIMLSATYLANHPKEAESYAQMNKQGGLSVTQAMLATGPVIGIISGLVFVFLPLSLQKSLRNK